MSSYPSSTLAYPHPNQLLDSLVSISVSSTSSTFTLSSVVDSSPLPATTLDSSTSSDQLPSISSTSSNQLPSITTLLTTTAAIPLPVLSPLQSSIKSTPSMTESSLFLHPQDAVATSPNLQQYSAVRQLTGDLQKRKPRHPRRPQPPFDGIGPPVRRLVHTAVYKQKIAQYIDALKLYEKHLDELINQTTLELDKLNNTLPPSKLRKFKLPQLQYKHISPLNIQIPSHNCSNYHNYSQCHAPRCSHLPVPYNFHSPLPPLPLSPALIPIRIEPITPSSQSPTPLNDLDNLVTSLNDVD